MNTADAILRVSWPWKEDPENTYGHTSTLRIFLYIMFILAVLLRSGSFVISSDLILESPDVRSTRGHLPDAYGADKH
jgi:hypothetical protein